MFDKVRGESIGGKARTHFFQHLYQFLIGNHLRIVVERSDAQWKLARNRYAGGGCLARDDLLKSSNSAVVERGGRGPHENQEPDLGDDNSRQRDSSPGTIRNRCFHSAA